MSYDFIKIESKWQKIWDEKKDLYHGEDDSSKPKHYHLTEFTYPSGAGLHVGHCMGYGASDAYVRMKRMQGYNVMFPTGWDSFGLPTENYAIKTGRKPAEVTLENTDIFRRQMKEMGFSYDWDREIDTSDPNYFKWTQWIFLQFYKHAIIDDPTSPEGSAGQSGKLVEVADDDTTTPRLAFQLEMPINWCPSCMTGLANEEVIAGKCERCGTETTKKMQKQWMLRITAYADRLIKDLDTVDYLEKIKTQQVNWIGRSEGVEVKFQLKSGKQKIDLGNKISSEKIDKMLNTMDKVNKAFKEKNIKVWFNGTFAVAGYYGKMFKDPSDLDCGVLKKDFIDACNVLNGLGYKKIEEKENEIFKVFLYEAGGFTLEIGTFDHDLGNQPVELDGHKFLAPDAKWLAQCYRKVANKKNRIGKNDIQRAEFLESLSEDFLEVFTTRPDTLFGATFMVVAPEHDLIMKYKKEISNYSEVDEYVSKSINKSEIERTDLTKEKTGVEIKGIKAINPVNDKEIPIFVADYVLSGYGTGAVMAVPAHDERDYEFANKYNIPIIEVIIPTVTDEDHPPKEGEEIVFRRAVQAILINPKNKKLLALKWKKFPWTTLITGGVEDGEDIVDSATREIIEETGYKNIKHVKTLGGPVESNFYFAHKKVNRKAHFSALVFELINEEKDEIGDEEKEIHDLAWMTWDELYNDKNFNCSERWIWKERLEQDNTCFSGNGVNINSGFLDGLETIDAKIKVAQWLEEKNVGKKTINYKLRDWIFSRQHYWGEPIPIIHCEKCGVVPMNEKDLPLTLPEVDNYKPTNTGQSPLAAITDWVNIKCPKCGGVAKRETDTMPNWAGSSWYFLRYCDPKNTEKFASDDRLKYWMSVDLYNGGMEHTTLHLLYSRFWNKFLFDLGVVPTTEPYQKRIAHGIILGSDGRKMSKSFGNVINPDDVIKQYGADTTRAYIMFIGPYDTESAWNMAGVAGVSRFLNRVFNNISKVKENFKDSKELLIKLNQSIVGITDDLENFRLNTVVSKLMELNNLIEKCEGISKESYEKFIQVLFPVAPYIASELWEKTGKNELIDLSIWPKPDNNYLIADEIEIVVQINGKVRDKIMVPSDISDDALKSTALESDKIKENLEGKKIIKTIVVPKKLVSIVVK